jgi:hypothetical protein
MRIQKPIWTNNDEILALAKIQAQGGENSEAGSIFERRLD